MEARPECGSCVGRWSIRRVSLCIALTKEDIDQWNVQFDFGFDGFGRLESSGALNVFLQSQRAQSGEQGLEASCQRSTLGIGRVIVG